MRIMKHIFLLASAFFVYTASDSVLLAQESTIPIDSLSSNAWQSACRSYIKLRKLEVDSGYAQYFLSLPNVCFTPSIIDSLFSLKEIDSVLVVEEFFLGEVITHRVITIECFQDLTVWTKYQRNFSSLVKDASHSLSNYSSYLECLELLNIEAVDTLSSVRNSDHIVVFSWVKSNAVSIKVLLSPDLNQIGQIDWLFATPRPKED